jgi:aryl-alcohol dehydrogenase-like predicted oxidoreductase
MEYTTIDSTRISKLTLGTAQLGMSYGIANFTGKPDHEKAREILKVAADHGVNCFDTALSYGDSENIIGSFLSSYRHFAELPVIVTKLPPVNLNGRATFKDVYHHVREQAISSMKHLKIEKLPIYLLHRASDIEACDNLILESLLELQSKGIIGLLGVSVYAPEEVELALKVEAIRAIQIPINIFDHRLIKRGLLTQLSNKGFIVFARSVFLQGLFFISPENLPSGLELAKEPLTQVRELSREQGINVPALALTFVRDLSGVTSLVFGAETPGQVLENINLMNSPPLPLELRERITSMFSNLPLELINPSLWHLNR